MKMIAEEKQIYLYGDRERSAPLVLMNTFEGDGSEVFAALKGLTDKKFCLAVVSDINWEDEMSPWECPPLYKNEAPFLGGAEAYLEKLTKKILPGKILPAISEEPGFSPERIVIAGYSLAGLFAIYSLYKTDVFTSAVSASGSMWFPDFMEYTKTNAFCRKPEKVYFSLGDKEAKTRNPHLRTVEEKTGELFERYRELGIDTVFEMNPGNHFKEADLRLAKGIAWVLG